MKLIAMQGGDGTSLNAKVEVGYGEIVVHSRSGGGNTARNPDYRQAVEAILRRLAEQSIKPNVYLDSQPVQHLPLDQRQIASGAQLTGTFEEQFNFLIRAMNAGTNSNGAWRRILFQTPPISASRLTNMLMQVSGTNASPAINRLPNGEQRKVTAENVHNAVERLVAGEDAPNFAESRDYDLITRSGERLAPKKVFGLALEEALGIETFPVHFSAGWSQPCFQILQDAGYKIIRKTTAFALPMAEVTKALGSLPPDNEERSWAEGDIRIVTHLRRERLRNPKAAEAKRKAVRDANGGRLACEHCPTDWYVIYPAEIAEGIFDIHHTIPLTDMSDDHETMLEDLLCLCANCHRAEHRRMALGMSSATCAEN